MTSPAAIARGRGRLERRSLGIAASLSALVVLGAAGWQLGFGDAPLLTALATCAGSLAILLPAALYARWSTLKGQDADSAARRMVGLAGLKLVGTLTLMVIAFAAFPDKALWVLVGVIAAAIAQSVGIVMASQRSDQ